MASGGINPTQSLPAEHTGHAPLGYSLVFEPVLGGAFRASDTGFDSSGAPAWRTRLPHGRTQPANKEPGYYSDAQLHPCANPIQLIDGKRALVAEHRSVIDAASGGRFDYTASVITSETTFTLQYGFVEERLKLPDVSGAWAAFWLLPADKSWPPEIDIMEAMGSHSAPREATSYTYSVAQHWLEGKAHKSNVQWINLNEKGIRPHPDIYSEFHTYGLEWTPATLRSFFDGALVREETNSFSQAAFLVLNIAVGGTWPGTPRSPGSFPAAMLIDFVRVYQKGSFEAQ